MVFITIVPYTNYGIYNYGIYNELVTGANLNQQTSLGGLILHGCFNKISSGWWYTYPSEKYESQLGS